MPIYEYRCLSCGAVQEVLQKINDKPLKKCPACSGTLEKLISRSSFQLKGSGWYATDYGGKGTSGESGDRPPKDSSSPSSSSGGSASSDEKSSSAKSSPASGNSAAKASSKSRRSGGESSE